MEHGGRPEIVVITGGTAGVGRATALRFARERAWVAVLARGPEALEATARDIESLGGRALPIRADVSDAEQVFAAADLVEREWGPMDIWINNAMTTVFGPVSDLSPREFQRVTDVTYHGYVWGTQAALSTMRKRNRGTIVQVGSALAYRGIPLQSAYCAAKHAIRAFTDSLRCELIHEQIDVHLTLVHLPGVNTPQFRQCLNKMGREPQPVPPIFQPEIAAEAIWFCAHNRRREVYVGHPTVETVMGQKLAPGLLDRYLASTAWEGQFTPQRADRTRPNNLFEPVPGDHGSHGVFDHRARKDDLMARITTWLGAGGVRFALLWIAPVWGGVVLLRRASQALTSEAASSAPKAPVTAPPRSRIPSPHP